MLVRAGGGDFRKLSIPRDTLAQIPGQPENKINSAYAVGGAKLTVRTIEKFLGINIDQVAIVDFDGFRRFIDTIGGVKVNVPTTVCSSVSGGAFKLELSKGEHTLNGFQAITLARTRENNLVTPNGVCENPPAITDVEPGPVPAADPQRGQGPPHRSAPPPLQPRQGAVHRLGRAAGDGLEHGRVDHASARVRGADRVQQRQRRPEAGRHHRSRQPDHPAGGVRCVR